MADTRNERLFYQEDLKRVFVTALRITPLTDPKFVSDLQNNRSVNYISGSTTTATVETLTDVEDLESPPTFPKGPVTESDTVTRGFIRGAGKVNRTESKEMKGGQQLEELELNTQIGYKMALDFEQKQISHIASNTFNATNKNQFSIGASDKYIDQATGVETGSKKSELADDMYVAIRQMLHGYVNTNLIGGLVLAGDSLPDRFVYVCNIEVADMFAERYWEKGILQRRNDIAGMADQYRAVYESELYRGSLPGGIAMLGVPEGLYAHPTSTTPWNSYLWPTRGAVYAGASPEETYNGFTEDVPHTNVRRRSEVWRYHTKIEEPTQVLRLQIKSESS